MSSNTFQVYDQVMRNDYDCPADGNDIPYGEYGRVIALDRGAVLVSWEQHIPCTYRYNVSREEANYGGHHDQNDIIFENVWSLSPKCLMRIGVLGGTVPEPISPVVRKIRQLNEKQKIKGIKLRRITSNF